VIGGNIMKNIRSMNYVELYDNFNIILDMKYMQYIITDKDVLKFFYKKYPRDGSNDEQSSFLKIFFQKNFKHIDNEAYVFFTLKTLKEELLTAKYNYIAQRCNEALKGSNYSFFEIGSINSKPGDEIKLIRASDLTGEYRDNNDSENSRRIRELKEKIDLNKLFSIYSTDEMRKIYSYNEDLSLYLSRLGIIEALSECQELSMRKKMRLLSLDNSEELSEIISKNKGDFKKVPMEKFYFRMPEYLEKYPDYFDLDKLLLIAAFRTNEYLEKTKLTEDERREFSDLLVILKDSIKSKSTTVGSIVCSCGVNEKSDYSYKKLCKDCTRIADNGLYLSKVDEIMIRDDIEIKPDSIIEVDPAYLRIMEFTSQELNMFCENEGVLKFLFENGVITKYQLTKVLSSARVPESDFCDLVNSGSLDENSINCYLGNNKIISENVFKVLNDKGLFSSEDKLQYYLEGRIELAFLHEMSDDEKVELSRILTPEKLIELYRDSNKMSEYMRYSALYRELIIKNADKEEREEIGEKLIEATDGEIDDEDLTRFYEQHLISFKTLGSWSGFDLVTKLMREGKLRPADVKEICRNENYDYIIDILKDPNISRNNKIAIFRTTFTDDKYVILTDEQKMLKDIAKEEALKALNLKESRTVVTSGQGRKRGVNVENKKRKEYVSEPLNRWDLIELLDKDYSYEMLDSGMMIFKLPNVQDGIIILEKMYKNDKPDYARATKVLRMTIEDFERIKPELIHDGDIPCAVVDSHPALCSKCESIWHTPAWGQRIAELAGYRIDGRRDEKNIADIDREIDKIKESRRLR